MATDSGDVRIAELMATLSYAADLGLGQPMEHCLRQTVIALRLSALVGATQAEREATYVVGLMMNVYCHADAAEQARWFGDDIAFKGDGYRVLEQSAAERQQADRRPAGDLHQDGDQPHRAHLHQTSVSSRAAATLFASHHGHSAASRPLPSDRSEPMTEGHGRGLFVR
jgi:hypothetical protein